MKKCILAFILVFISLNCTGCWDARELNQIAFVTAMAIDKINGEYVLTTQVINPTRISTQQSKSDQSPVITYKTKGKSVTEALQKRTSLGSRENFTGQLKILIIGEDLAKDGLTGISDYLSRDIRIEASFYIVVARGTTAENVLKVLTPLENSPADSMYSSIQVQAETQGNVLATNADDLFANIENEGEEVKLTGLQILGRKAKGNMEDNVKKMNPDAILKISNISVFHHNKLAGWLNEEESKGLILILDKAKTIHFSIPCPNEPNKHIDMEVKRNKTNLQGVLVNNKPKIKMEMSSDVNVNEVQCNNLKISDPSNINIIQNLTRKELKRMVEMAITAAQKKYKTDVLAFGNTMYRTQPQYWKQHKRHWDSEFQRIPAEISNQVAVYYTGVINDPITNPKE